MKEPLTFARADLSGEKADATFTRIMQTGAPATEDIGAAAKDFLIGKLRALQFAEPKTDRIELFNRLTAAYPGAWLVIASGAFEGYAPDDEAVEDYYAVEGA
jgi:hypothetical protein